MAHFGNYFSAAYFSRGYYGSYVLSGSSSAKGCIHVNQAATPYHFRCELISTHSEVGTSSVVMAPAMDTLTWGNVYSAGAHGVRVTLLNYNDPVGVPNEKHTYSIVTPWGSFTATINGWATFFKSRLEFDNLRLVRLPDCTWTLTFDALRWYVDDDGSGFVLKFSVGATVQNGVSFDLRKDVYERMPDAYDDPIVLSPPDRCVGCATDYATQQVYTALVHSKSIGGWRFGAGSGWGTDTVAMLAVTPLAGCACSIPFEDFIIVDSWSITAEAHYSDYVTKTDTGPKSCVCGLPDPGHFDYNTWHGDRDFDYTKEWIRAIPTTSGITRHYIERHLECSTVVTNDNWSTTETITYSEYEKSALHQECTVYCDELTFDLPCIPPGGGGDAPRGCLPGPNTECSYDAYVRVTWPDLPSCSGPGLLAYDISPDQRHAHAYDDSGLVVGSMRNGRPFTWIDTIVAPVVDWVAYRWNKPHRSQQLYVYYGDAGTAKVAKSADEGIAWTALVTVSTGVDVGDFETCRDGRVFCYYIESGSNTVKCKVYDKGMNLTESLTTNIADADTRIFRVRESYGTKGEWRICIQYYDLGGNLIFKVSDKEGKVFT